MAARVSDHTLVVLNSYTAATDLLEKRSSIYLNRPVLVLAEPWVVSKRRQPRTQAQLTTGAQRRLDPNVRVETYGDDWREGRRLLREHVQPSAVQQFLHRLLESQSDLDDSIKLSVPTSRTSISSHETDLRQVCVQNREADSQIWHPGRRNRD